jgi:hypothetical protein
MIIVRIELRSARSENRNRPLGAMTVANIGGTATRGDYAYALQRPGGRVRQGEVKGFPRKQKSALELLRRCLNDLHERGELP